MTYKSLICQAIAMLCSSITLANAQMPSEANGQARPIRLAVSSQPIAAALNDFARQSGLHVVIGSDVAAGVKSAPVDGTFTPEAALQQLLMNTGLRYEYLDPQTVAVLGKEKPSAEVRNESNALAQLRLAQAETSPASRESTGEGTKGLRDSSEYKFQNLEEIVVTAQKREERLIDVPISIVAMTGDDLQQRKIGSVDDLSLVVPGLSVISSGGFSRRIFLRGVSNPFGTGSLIGLYLDEASATSSPGREVDLRTYDLERIEVLRGPQGTLYGEGSVGGTIRFITNSPQLDTFATNTTVSALYTQDGELGGRVEGALNVPLIQHELGLRIAGTYDQEGGWIDQPAANRKNINEQDLANVRIKGLWQPAKQFSVNAMAVIHRNDTSNNQGEDSSGNFAQVFNLTTAPSVEDDYDLYNLTLAYDFASVRVLSTTSYIEQRKEMRDLGYHRQFAPPPSPVLHLLLTPYTLGVDNFTQELRLTSTGSGPFQWTIGGFHRDAQVDVDITGRAALLGPPGSPLPAPFLTHTRNRSNSWAIFGDMSYELTDRFMLGAGLRFFEDDQEFESGIGAAATNQKGTFDSLNPRVYARYKLFDQVNVYASAAKGFRSGGFNAASRPAYDPESVWTYELGTKMSLASGRLSADLAIFSSDYTDYQIVGINQDIPAAGNITSNAGDATIEGIEWALTWHLADQWSLSFNGTFVDSEFVEIDATSSSHAVGDPLDYFPEYGYTLSAQRGFSWRGRPGFARLDYSEQGRMSFRNRSIGQWYFDESDVVNMLNFNVRLPLAESLSLGVFGQNLLNDRGFTSSGSIEEVASRSRPRTFGIEFGVTFR